MHQTQLRLVPFLLILLGIMACKTDNLTPADQPDTPAPTSPRTTPDTASHRLRIQVGSRTFTATLLSNATVTAFKARLPMTVEMSELNGNEKLYRFPANLPTNSANPGTIRTGDLMLYGANTLVLFYKQFPTVYSYTKLGQIDNPSGLEAVLGSGSVTITYELE